MGKISSQVSKGLGAAIQEVKNKISDDTNPEELLNSGAETQKKRHRRTKAEMQTAKEAKVTESQDNSLFEALDIHEEFQEEKVEDNKDNIGLTDYFNKGGVTIIEWADMIEDELPSERLDIEFKFIDENTRVLVLKPYGKDYEDICDAVL